MKVYLHEIKDTEKRLTYTQSDEWLASAVEEADERFEEEPALPRPKSAPTPRASEPARKVDAMINLRKVDNLYLVSGQLHTHLKLLCSRCALPFHFPIDSRFSSLYCKDPAMAGVGHLAPREGDTSDDPILHPTGRNFGVAKSKSSEELHDALDEAQLNEVGSDLDITYIAEDHIDLGSVVTEQLRFRVPFQPLCRETCKGLCIQCGTNLNEAQCACSKIKKSSPFASLAQRKLPGNSH
jgi:uncharacterized protein